MSKSYTDIKGGRYRDLESQSYSGSDLLGAILDLIISWGGVRNFTGRVNG